MAKEMVHHPDHYQGKGGLEVWQVQEAFTADLKGVIAGDACALIKYACRWPKKNGVEDLKKIIEYANHLIQKLEEQEPTTEVCEDGARHRMQAIVDELLFKDENSAEETIRRLKELLTVYGHVRVLDVLDLVDARAPYDSGVMNYGWTNFEYIYARPYSSEHGTTWHIEFPFVEKIDKEKESN